MFYIFGSPRSGTTFLKESLCLNPEIIILNETDFLPGVAHVLNSIADPAQGKKIIYKIISNTTFSSSICKYLSGDKLFEIINTSEYNLSSIIMSLYQEILSLTDAKIIGDKTPNYIVLADFLESLGLFDANLKFIHIVRDLRDVLLSVKKMTWSPKNSAEFLLFSETWAHSNLTMSELGKKHPKKYFFLRYEDFVAYPQKYFQEIFKFLDVNYDRPILNWSDVKKDVHDPSIHPNIGLPPQKDRAYAWKNNFNNQEIIDLTFPATEALQFYGYNSR